MSASFSTGNWETISSWVRFLAVVLVILLGMFRQPLSERLRALIFRKHEEREEKKNLLITCRASVSNCLNRQDSYVYNKNMNPNDGQLPLSSVTNEISYLSLRRHLDPEPLGKIDLMSEMQRVEMDWISLDIQEREKIALFSSEIDRLAKLWKINV